MKTKNYFIIISLLVLFSLPSCALNIKYEMDEPISELPKTDYEYLLKGMDNPIALEENSYYIIYQDDNHIYLYIIFDINGDVVTTEQYTRCPSITMINDHLISVSLQAGTGIETQWTYYFDIEKDVISRTFYGVLDQMDDMIIYLNDYDTVTVRAIFDKSILYRTIKDFKELSQESATPFVGAKFIDGAKKVSITYFNDNYDEITEVFDVR